jgi:proteic killer suppression protein
VIRSFLDRRTARLFDGTVAKGIAPSLARRARQRLLGLDAAQSLTDLAARPANRLEALKGDRAGQWAARVSDQWRICFVWRDGDAERVELVHCH